MTRDELLDLLLRCNGPQLDAVTARLHLPAAFLPGSSQAPGTRAVAIMELVEQQGQLASFSSPSWRRFSPAILPIRRKARLDPKRSSFSRPTRS